MFIEFDADFNQTKKVKEWLKSNKIQLVKFIENGPGGGNPNFTILIDNFNQHLQFIKFYYDIK